VFFWLQAHVTVAPSTSSLAYCFLSEDGGDGPDSAVAATLERALAAQTSMSKVWPNLREVLQQSAEYASPPHIHAHAQTHTHTQDLIVADEVNERSARHMELIQRTMTALATPLTTADVAQRLHLTLPSVVATGAHTTVCTDRATGVVTFLPVSRGMCAGVVLT
jgi:hypothetical protein